MRAHGRGGTLLVVPDGSPWRESVVEPLPYAVSPPYTRMAALAGTPDRVRSAVDAVAGLTAVDGATVITADHALLAFGVKIRRREGFAPVDRVVITEPVEGAEAVVAPPAELGGTRHLSAAQFAHDQRHARALVASQDGRFTVFAWSEDSGAVGAHRIEVLLL